MVRYKIIGERGSYITSKSEAKRMKGLEVGDWTNFTGDIKKIIKIPDKPIKKKKKLPKAPFGIKMPKFRL